MSQQIPKNTQLNNWPSPSHYNAMINKSFENEKAVCFRFDDLSEQGKKKMCRYLKEKSPIYTLKKPVEKGGLSKAEIYHSLRVANPILFKNWNKGFSYGQLPRGAALEISRICYYICRRKPTTEAKNIVEDLIKTDSNHNFGYRIHQDQTIREYEQWIAPDTNWSPIPIRNIEWGEIRNITLN